MDDDGAHGSSREFKNKCKGRALVFFDGSVEAASAAQEGKWSVERGGWHGMQFGRLSRARGPSAETRRGLGPEWERGHGRDSGALVEAQPWTRRGRAAPLPGGKAVRHWCVRESLLESGRLHVAAHLVWRVRVWSAPSEVRGKSKHQEDAVSAPRLNPKEGWAEGELKGLQRASHCLPHSSASCLLVMSVCAFVTTWNVVQLVIVLISQTGEVSVS